MSFTNVMVGMFLVVKITKYSILTHCNKIFHRIGSGLRTSSLSSRLIRSLYDSRRRKRTNPEVYTVNILLSITFTNCCLRISEIFSYTAYTKYKSHVLFNPHFPVNIYSSYACN